MARRRGERGRLHQRAARPAAHTGRRRRRAALHRDPARARIPPARRGRGDRPGGPGRFAGGRRTRVRRAARISCGCSSASSTRRAPDAVSSPSWSARRGSGRRARHSSSRARARAAGFAVHVGRCLEEEGAPPYRPWLQVLRALLAGRTPRELDPCLDARGRRGALVAARCPIARAEPARQTGARCASRSSTPSRSCCGPPRARSRGWSLLDDLHRADGSSLLLLRHVAREVGDARVLILGTYRAGRGRRAAGASARRAAPGRHAASRCPDSRARRSAELVREVVRPRSTRPSWRTRCTRAPDGNPLFVEEITRALAAEGELRRAGRRRARRARGARGRAQVIRARVARLPAPARDALEVAAVIGREFDLPVLERACPADRRAGAARAVLEGAVDAGIVAPVSARAGRYRFVHILLRDALYDALAVRAARRAARRGGSRPRGARRPRARRPGGRAGAPLRAGDRRRRGAERRALGAARRRARPRARRLRRGDGARRTGAARARLRGGPGRRTSCVQSCWSCSGARAGSAAPPPRRARPSARRSSAPARPLRPTCWRAPRSASPAAPTPRPA